MLTVDREVRVGNRAFLPGQYLLSFGDSRAIPWFPFPCPIAQDLGYLCSQVLEFVLGEEMQPHDLQMAVEPQFVDRLPVAGF